jgi:hypothetical protein
MKYHGAISAAGKAERRRRLRRLAVVVRRDRLNRTSIHGAPQKLRDISLTKNRNLAQILRMFDLKTATMLKHRLRVEKRARGGRNNK